MATVAFARAKACVSALALAVVLQLAPVAGPGHAAVQAHASGAAPVVYGITPNSASTSSPNLQVTIYGSGFTGATGVRFGTVTCVTFYVSDDSHITAIPPGGAAGSTVDVYVLGPGGTSSATAADRFSYVASGIPSVNGITPNSGPATGQTYVTLVGTGLSNVRSVQFGPTTLSNNAYYAADDNHLYVSAPAGTAGSTVDVKVTNSAGTSSTSAADQYTYLAAVAPTVRAVSPNRGPSGGKTGVQILGHGLAGATAVHFGTVAAASIGYATDEGLYVTSPPGTAGTTVDITVTTPLGTSPTGNADHFTYAAPSAPAINAISPSRGPGGTVAYLYGSGFLGATAVQFGATGAGFTVFDDNTIGASAPAGTASTVVDVRVTTPAGTSSAVVQDRFTFTNPATSPAEVDAVTPNRGPAAGGSVVTIVGSGFFSPTAVNFGSTAALSYSASSDGSTITATSPPGTSGTTVDVVVTTASGASIPGPADRFSYLSAAASIPTINAVDPNHGSQYGGSQVTIHGSGFTTSGTTVMFGTTSATNFTVIDSRTINVYSAPAGTAGSTVDISVATASGPSVATNADRYSFDAVAAPVISAISPATAYPGASIYVTGTDVASITSATFGTTPVSGWGIVAANVIQLTVPSGTAGSTVDVRVTNPSGTSAVSSADSFTYSTAPPVPTVTSVGPGSGSGAGGTTVYISGSGFLSGVTAVNFGTKAASSFYAVSDNVIQAITSAHTVGAVDVTVVNSSGTSSISSADQYEFTTPPVPSVSNVSPATGPSNGGSSVYVAGSGFTAASAVLFGNASASFTVVSDSLITVYHSPVQGTNPATVDITVTAPGGTSPTSTADHFTFGAAVVPVVNAISPSTGPAAGGTTVYVSGTGFTAATRVSFGTTSASFSVISDNLISAFSPAQGTNPATVDVTVTAGSSTSVTSTADQFTWSSTPPPSGPVVNGVSPNQGSTLGGSTVTVYGSGLSGPTSVKFGASAGTIQYGNDTQIVVRSPAGVAGTVDVTVTTAAGTSTTTAADRFTYVAPTVPVVNAVDPSRGSSAGGGSATVYGHGFTGATAVRFGSTAPAYFYVSNDTTLYVNQIPPGAAGSVDVTISGPGGTSAGSAADQYTYVSPGVPVIYAVSPNRGTTLGGTNVTIYGVGLAGATSVTFGSTAAGYYPGYQNDTQIYASSPAGAAGTVDVIVTTGVGTSARQATDVFRYVTPGPPVINAVAPNRGSSAGGTYVRLLGTSLSSATSVSFGGVAGSFSPYTNQDSELDVYTPSASAGTVDIVVTTPFGTSAVSAADHYTYFTPPIPVVTAVSPSSGSAAGGTFVFVSGSGLTGATNVLFGTACSVNYGFNQTSDNLVAVPAPAGVAGSTVDVQVVTPGGTSASVAADKFSYTAPVQPVVTAVGPATGPQVGGTTVYITGTDVASATGVSFGATPALYFYPYYSYSSTYYGSEQSDTLIVAVSPPGTPGSTVDVTVTTPGGVSSASSLDRFTYTASPVPSVTAVSPNSGPFSGGDAFAGGNLVYLTGSGFSGASAVHFGTQSVVQAQRPGTLGLAVPNRPGATSVSTPTMMVRLPITEKRSGSSFTSAPRRTALVPVPLPRSQKPRKDVNGTRPALASQAGARQFSTSRDQTAATGSSRLLPSVLGGGGGGGGCGCGPGPCGGYCYPAFFAIDDNVLEIIRTPAGTNGATVDVTVTSPAGTSATSAADHYTYGPVPLPSVSAVSPTGGPFGGGNDVLISGASFTSATGVKFGAATAKFTVYSDNLIDAASPPGVNGSVVDVTVTNPGGSSATSTNDEYTYGATATPVVSIIKPAGGPGGTSVLITGSGLSAASAVHFGTTSISAKNWSVLGDTLIQAMAPAGTVGSVVDVTVTSPGGTSATSMADQFTFAVTPAPIVTIVSPNSGSSAGGTTAYVTGSGLTGASTVNFGPSAGTSLVVISDTLIQVVGPAGSGSVDVRVVGLGGTSAVNTGDVFTYVATGPPAVSGVSPNFGPIAGGTSVTITGTNLTGATAVHFGTVAATVTSSTAGQVLTTSPAASGPGTVDVTVTTPAGTSAVTGVDQFTYGNTMSKVSTQQYHLAGSDGASWVDMDASGNLTLTIIPATSVHVLLMANADLWTANAGYNQDLGIDVNGTIAAWKESGGFAGTFSPNAAFVQTEVSMAGGTAYTVKLRWKTNKNAPGATIYAGAGPISGQFSPTRLTAQVITTSAPMAMSTQQYTLANSNGSTWSDMDSTNLSLTLTPSANSTAVIGGNSDLWTSSAGYNQDIAITINGTVAAWKESGGFAGTFSPNAAYVQTVQSLTAGTTYTIKLQWKTNKNAAGATIWAGAGPIAGQYSPTSLIVHLLPDSAPLPNKVSTQQYQLTSSDGATWSDIDATNLSLTMTPSANALVMISGNSDFWTSSAGYNQDLGIDVNGSIVAWKESGGFAGTFSPNAAYVQAVIPLNAGTTYTIKLRWKTNKSAAGATIWAGAGPIGGQYSPTSLAVRFAS